MNLLLMYFKVQRIAVYGIQFLCTKRFYPVKSVKLHCNIRNWHTKAFITILF